MHFAIGFGFPNNEDVQIAGRPRQSQLDDRKASDNDKAATPGLEFAAKIGKILFSRRTGGRPVGFRVKWSISHWSASPWDLKRYTPFGILGDAIREVLKIRPTPAVWSEGDDFRLVAEDKETPRPGFWMPPGDLCCFAPPFTRQRLVHGATQGGLLPGGG